MKKRDIWISIAIIAAAVLLLCLHSRGGGRIEIDAGDAVAELQLRNNWFKNTTITSAAEPALASAGVHRPRRLSISMGQDGHTWRIDSRGPWANLSRIRVKALRTTALRLGSPFIIKPEVRRNGSSVDIDYAIFGQAGERYEKFAVKDNRAVRKAKLELWMRWETHLRPAASGTAEAATAGTRGECQRISRASTRCWWTLTWGRLKSNRRKPGTL
ncbi:MAG: hypothetical protein ISS70_06300 [Phycisphaerae bacterium]|nr:hypothetical protein [Phycisphaerae bacterium]